MEWDVEYTDEFETWWNKLTVEEQDALAGVITLLQQYGPNLKRPMSDVIKKSKHANMKELRAKLAVKGEERLIRTLYAFDPKRTALLLIGGDKSGDTEGWYDRNVPNADRIFDRHLKEIEEERLAKLAKEKQSEKGGNMAKNFKTLLAKMSPERRARIKEIAENYQNEMTLLELREARAMTQTTMASLLDVNQPAISKIERQADMYISTLRNYVHAMGGHLRIEAVFSNGQVIINQFGELDTAKRAAKPRAKNDKRYAASAVARI